MATADLPTTAAHPFYQRVNALLDDHHFDAFVEGACQRFYDDTMGRPSLTPGIYFRCVYRQPVSKIQNLCRGIRENQPNTAKVALEAAWTFNHSAHRVQMLESLPSKVYFRR